VGKVPIVGLRERKGQVMAKAVKATDKATLQDAILDASRLGSTVCTNEHGSFVLGAQFDHSRVCHSAKQFVDGMPHTNGIESVWAVLQQGFCGTYHSFSKKHIGLYVDELVLRLNKGKCAIGTMDRPQALCRGMKGKRLTYKMLLQKKTLHNKHPSLRIRKATRI